MKEKKTKKIQINGLMRLLVKENERFSILSTKKKGKVFNKKKNCDNFVLIETND